MLGTWLREQVRTRVRRCGWVRKSKGPWCCVPGLPSDKWTQPCSSVTWGWCQYLLLRVFLRMKELSLVITVPGPQEFLPRGGGWWRGSPPSPPWLQDAVYWVPLAALAGPRWKSSFSVLWKNIHALSSARHLTASVGEWYCQEGRTVLS